MFGICRKIPRNMGYVSKDSKNSGATLTARFHRSLNFIARLDNKWSEFQTNPSGKEFLKISTVQNAFKR